MDKVLKMPAVPMLFLLVILLAIAHLVRPDQVIDTGFVGVLGALLTAVKVNHSEGSQ
jgi:hypothetical protein